MKMKSMKVIPLESIASFVQLVNTSAISTGSIIFFMMAGILIKVGIMQQTNTTVSG